MGSRGHVRVGRVYVESLYSNGRPRGDGSVTMSSAPILKVLSPRDKSSAQDSSFLLTSPSEVHTLFPYGLRKINPLPHKPDKVHFQPFMEP